MNLIGEKFITAQNYYSEFAEEVVRQGIEELPIASCDPLMDTLDWGKTSAGSFVWVKRYDEYEKFRSR